MSPGHPGVGGSDSVHRKKVSTRLVYNYCTLKKSENIPVYRYCTPVHHFWFGGVQALSLNFPIKKASWSRLRIPDCEPLIPSPAYFIALQMLGFLLSNNAPRFRFDKVRMRSVYGPDFNRE